MAESTDIFNPMELATIALVKDAIRNKVSYLKKIIPAIYYDDMFLSGGAVASLIQGGLPKDWDVYFNNPNTQKFVVDHFIADNPDEIAVVEEKYRELVVNDKLITENAITLKTGIQLITKHNGTPEEVRSTFDFVHCKPYYHFGHDTLVISKEQYDLCAQKKLKINNPKSVTPYRQVKFDQRGYTWLIP